MEAVGGVMEVRLEDGKHRRRSLMGLVLDHSQGCGDAGKAGVVEGRQHLQLRRADRLDPTEALEQLSLLAEPRCVALAAHEGVDLRAVRDALDLTAATADHRPAPHPRSDIARRPATKLR